MYKIVQSCFLAIIASVWVAAHRDLPVQPGPYNLDEEQHLFIGSSFCGSIRKKSLDARQPAFSFFATLLVIEAMLARARIQVLTAYTITQEFESAREMALLRRRKADKGCWSVVARGTGISAEKSRSSLLIFSFLHEEHQHLKLREHLRFAPMKSC